MPTEEGERIGVLPVIEFSEEVHVPHSPEIVWSVLSDPERCVECIEGSRLGEFHEDGSFDAFMAVKFAGLKVSFKANVTLELNQEGKTGRLSGSGGDKRGSTRVTMGADYAVIADGNGSSVTLDGSAEVKGPLAGLVSTGASLVVDRMAKSFTRELAAKCDAISAVGTEGAL
ncbi:CoxG family protein [Brevibacterium oceani]|uniref:CoxG family protein n=1 Tax=Brevibacterium oceani TaxID=358099 RepID=UPI001B32E98D|nr:SRPBCC domain-containing protein [Brevibacterium oceani]